MSDGAIRGVLFDLDQTLFDRAAAFSAFVNAELDRVGYPPSRRAQALGEIRAFDRSGYGDRPSFLRCLAGHFRWEDSDLESAFRGALLPHVRLAPGLRATLRRLRRRVRVGLLTDGSAAMQTAKIERLGLSDEFDRIQISGRFGRSKPDPETFLAFAEEWRMAPGSLCMVGDHLERDINGARRAGLRAVWMGSAEVHPDPGVILASSAVDLDRDPGFAEFLVGAAAAGARP